MTTTSFWKQGEVQAGRVLARRHEAPEAWTQVLMLPPDVIELRLRLGFIPADNHGRWQIEVLDPQSNELLALHSQPHFALHDLERVLGEVGARLGVLLDGIANPDPFP